MPFTEFLNKCDACGGNWTAMMMSGIRNAWPDVYAKLPNKEYTFDEVLQIAVDCGMYFEGDE